MVSIVNALQRAGAASIRLDAVGYAIKKPGTTSFMIPETFDFIDEFATTAAQRGLEVLVEVHSYYRRQVEIAQRVDRVYDFALPPLVLHALIAADPAPLLSWLQIRPQNAVTVLDTHDDIGVIDVGADTTDRSQPGLLTDAQLDALVESMHNNSHGTSRQSTGAAASNLDLYQVNTTYYEALGQDDCKYLAARALQFFTPGVPQVYYVGLLAGCNDMELLARTGVGRDVNRHYYTRGQIHSELARPVVASLIELIRLRNSHPAFDGSFTCDSNQSHIWLRWEHSGQSLQLDVDCATGFADITGDGVSWSTHAD